MCLALFGIVSSTPAQLNFLDGVDEEPLAVSASYKLQNDAQYGVIFVHAKIGFGYHTYAQDHGGVEVPTKIEIAKADGISFSGVFTPTSAPHTEMKDGSLYKSFDNEVTWRMPFRIEDVDDVENLNIGIEYLGQVCTDESCLPPDKKSLVVVFDGIADDLEIDASSIPASSDSQAQVETESSETADSEPIESSEFAEFYDPETKIRYEKLDGSSGTGTFWAAVVGAFLGGMLLNLMPCVFPVLGLKVLGFVEQAGNEPAKIRMHGIAFAGGLVVSMWCLAGAILALKQLTGQEVSWGQQMGNPYFVGGIVILLFVLGLNLVGVFEMGLFLTNVGSGGKQSDGYFGSFFSGILTTLVATPCSGPFLGAAMGYTLAQPPHIAMFLFTIFGLGIAVPYLVLSFIPSLIHLLPPPGGWMETFKKLMGFTLFAAAAFFAKSFGSQTGIDGLSWLLMAICVLSLAAFFYGKFSPAYVKAQKRWVWGWITPALVAGLGIWMYLDAAKLEAPEVVAEETEWQNWTPGKVEKLLADNKPVWVDYTADW